MSGFQRRLSVGFGVMLLIIVTRGSQIIIPSEGEKDRHTTTVQAVQNDGGERDGIGYDEIISKENVAVVGGP